MYLIMEPTDPPGRLGVRLEKTGWQSNLSWLTGERFDESEAIPDPIILRYDPESAGTYVRDFYKVPIPLMSRRLVDTLHEAGVDNLDLFPVMIHDLSGAPVDSHLAVNIIGAISAADPVLTEFDPRVPTRLMTAAIDKLVIDETRTGGHLMFRLAESVSAIIVHESVADRVEDAGFDSVVFMESDDFFSL
jgi:hypothetical protein